MERWGDGVLEWSITHDFDARLGRSEEEVVPQALHQTLTCLGSASRVPGNARAIWDLRFQMRTTSRDL